MKKDLVVLAVTRSEADLKDLRSIADRSGWELTGTPDCEVALSILTRLPVPVVLCDRDLPGRDWRESVKCLLSPVAPPCVILTSSVNDSYLWQEVVQTGGYDVLVKPFHEEQVVSTVRRAWIFWKAGCMLRQ
jgi:DNA-binding response OmpR family regulator